MSDRWRDRIRISARSVLAASGDAGLAVACGLAARQLWTDGAAAPSTIHLEVLLAFEGVGLLVQRVVWRGAEVGFASSAEKAGCLRGGTALASVLFGALGLMLYLPLMAVLLLVLAVSEPATGLAGAVVLVRKLAWAWAQRPRDAEELEALASYWRLSRWVHLGAFGLGYGLAVALLWLTGESGSEHADRVGYLIGSAVYFAVLALFVALDDPRMRAHRGFDRPEDAKERERLDELWVELPDLRALAALCRDRYGAFVPGVLLLIFVFEAVAPATPLGRSPVGWPLFLGLGGWLLVAGAARALGLTDRSVGSYAAPRATIFLIVMAGLWCAFWAALIAGAFVAFALAGGERFPEQGWRPTDLLAFGLTGVVMLWGGARLWAAPVNPFVFPGDERPGGTGFPTFIESWRMTASPRALFASAAPLALAATVLLAPGLAPLVYGAQGLVAFLARLWCYAVAAPYLALLAVERADTLRWAVIEQPVEPREDAPPDAEPPAPPEPVVVPLPIPVPAGGGESPRERVVPVGGRHGVYRHPSRDVEPPDFLQDGVYRVPVDLDLAIRIDDVALMLALVDRGADLAAFEKFPGTAVQRAAWCGSPEVLKALLERLGRERVAEPTERGDAPIHLVASNHARKTAGCMRVLLDAGADVEALDGQGHTALSRACREGSLDLVKMLVGAGADPAARDHQAFRSAVGFGKVEVMRFLRRKKGVPELDARELADRLHEEIQRGNDDGVDALLELGADPRLPYGRVPTIDAIGLAEMWDGERPGRWKRMIERLTAAAERLEREGRKRR